MDDVTIHVTETGFYDLEFTENEKLVEYLSARFPMFKFNATMSLAHLHPFKNLHQLEDIPLWDNADDRQIIQSIVDSLENFLASTVDHIARDGVAQATVTLSRIELSKKLNSTGTKKVLSGNLRAVFVKGLV